MQILGLGFGLGALAATLSFVVFTDLAFGWSSTLEIRAEPVHAIVRALASPWAWLWPEASPTLELVESTRFFRVAGEDHIHFVDPVVYGGWWPFLVMALGTFAVLPRVLTSLAIFAWLSRATAQAMGFTPGVERLLDRLTTAFVDTRAESAEPATGRPEDGLVPELDFREWWTARARDGAPPSVIRWAELAGDEALRLGIAPVLPGAPPIGIRDAGGRQSLGEDAALARECGREEGAVVVCVRGYEPPLLDFVDFLSGLRSEMGPERGLAVLLFDARERDVVSWQRKLVALGDPRLVVLRATLRRVTERASDE